MISYPEMGSAHVTVFCDALRRKENALLRYGMDFMDFSDQTLESFHVVYSPMREPLTTSLRRDYEEALAGLGDIWKADRAMMAALEDDSGSD